MGNSIYSYRCEMCLDWCGNERLNEIAGAKLYHHGGLGGHIFCLQCIQLNIKENNFHRVNEHYQNQLGCFNKSKTCQYCYTQNTNLLSKPIFKIYSAGKHKDKFMCSTCLFDKSYRRKKH